MKKLKALIIADNLCNIGDLALLQQTVFGLRATLGIADIAIKQWSPPSDALVHAFAEDNCALARSKWQFLFSPGHLVIVGGGQFVRNNVSIPYMLMQIFTLVCTRRPAVALAIGVGRLHSGWRRTLWRLLLGRFRVITTRDAQSMAMLQDILPSTTHYELTCDLVFLPSPLHQAVAESSATRWIIVAPCLSHAEDRLIDAVPVARMSARMAHHFNVQEVCLVPHDDRPEVDQPICKSLLDEIARMGVVTACLLDGCTLPQALERYRDCAAVLTNRLHAMIFALLANKPVLVIDDGNPKLRAFAKRFCVPLLHQDCDAAELDAALASECDPDVRKERAQALAMAKAEASRNFEALQTQL